MQYRCLDILISIILGILVVPIVVALAVAIRASMGSPIFFRQIRVGRGGLPFELIKFRTLIDARDAWGRSISDDRRQTKLGKIMRRTRMDELPELLNVFKGDMSIIGPRPLLADTLAALGPVGYLRNTVRPGLTGWAQVNGNTCLSDSDKFALDLWYIEHRSLALNVVILLRTLDVIIRGERISIHHLEQARSDAFHRHRLG